MHLAPLVVNLIYLSHIVKVTSLSTYDNYLTNHWPISNDQMNDVAGNAHMVQGNLTTFTVDRFGNPNSALSLNGGYTQVPTGVYFSAPQLTISAWVYPQKVGSYSRLIDFGNGKSSNNVDFALSKSSSYQSYLEFVNGSVSLNRVVSSITLTNKNWQFLTGTFNGSHLSMYIDANLTGIIEQHYDMPTISRKKNYVGKSNWPSDGYSWSYVDDLRFYNICLTHDQIVQLMNESSPYSVTDFSSTISTEISI